MAESEMYTLVAVETASIQSYIFNSNRLRENIGASYLVAMATGDWAIEAVQQVTETEKIDAPIDQDTTVVAEVLYSGGGNIVVLFRTVELARSFVRTLSRRVQRDAPGLRLTFASRPFDWDDALSHAVGNLLKEMRASRSEQPPLRGMGGLSVTVMGASTSMPSVSMQSDSDRVWQPYSAETLAKRAFNDEANDVLRATLNLTATDYHFPLDLDDLGRSKEDTSYVAVVHADGNGLGLLIQGIQDEFPAGKNRDYIIHMRDFSENVTQVASRAQQDMIQQLLASIYESESGERQILGEGRNTEPISLPRQGRRYILPFRPLVSGGDDVTFVCDGRIGLDLAVTFLTAFEKHTEAILGRKLTACAGVAIVKTHYPFARAYVLADDLAGSAKQARHNLELPDVNDAPGALDWYITTGGLYGDLDMMRKREYTVLLSKDQKDMMRERGGILPEDEKGQLTLRPVLTESVPGKAAYTWNMVQRAITAFQVKWGDHRNKAEALREVLRQGETATRTFKARYLSSPDSPTLPDIGDFEDGGWVDGICGYYDALELMDKYIPLNTDWEREA